MDNVISSNSPQPRRRWFVWFKRHKLITLIIISALLGGAYYLYQKQTNSGSAPRYVLAAVEKGMISTSISGSGQISASNQVEVKPKVSGDILTLSAKVGQEVKTGDVLAKLNSKEALKSVRDAQVSLESAQLSLSKIKRGSTAEEIAAATRKVETAKKDLAAAKDDLVDVQEKTVIDLANTYEDAQNSVEDAYSKADDLLNRQLDKVFTGINTDSPELTFLTSNSQSETDSKWQFLTAHNQALPQLKSLSSTDDSNQAAVDQALVKAKEQLLVIQGFLNKLNTAVNAAVVTLDFTQSDLDSFKSTVNTAKSTITTQINNLTAAQQNLVDQRLNNKDSLSAAQDKIDLAQDSLTQAEEDLKTVKAGNDPLDIKAQEISVRQRQIALADAREKLADYVVTVPFDGVIAQVDVASGDTVSSSDTIATVITKQRLAEISLNEVDAAKVKVGQKVTLAFDAVESLSLSGSVAEIDSIGTVEQGVVTYNVKIVFDTQEEAVKPGMSVSATIITDMKTDVLLIANAALKSQDDSYYVEMPNETMAANSAMATGVELKNGVRQQAVTIGLVSDTMTEITSGLAVGDLIVSKTINSASAATAASTAASTERSLFQMGGGGAPR